LPARLAGLDTGDPLVPGVRTYGSGLLRLTALPISPDLARQSLDAVREAGGQPTEAPGGQVLLASRGVLSLGVVRSTDGRRAYLVGGSVVPDVVLTASRELLAGAAA
jgi:hypothetical protein